jgi:uncharacterized protein DUF4384
MLIPLLLLALPADPAVVATSPDPPVRVSFNDDGKYVYGDRARVYLQSSARDGYVVVLRSDARGDVRVLSPVDPDDDQQIHGGKKYEAKGRGGREAFVVEDTAGQGVVLAAWSRTPFDLTRFERNAHWNAESLGETGGLSTSADDPETRLLGLVDSMLPDGHYEYDAATYVVFSPRLARAVYAYPYPYAWNGGWWGFDPWWGRPAFGARVVVVPGRFGFRRH